MRVKKCKGGYIDIYRNPENPSHSRIPIDRCHMNLERFLRDEIQLTKVCGCPSCDFRRNMLRKIEEELRELRMLRARVNKNKIKYVNNH